LNISFSKESTYPIFMTNVRQESSSGITEQIPADAVRSQLAQILDSSEYTATGSQRKMWPLSEIEAAVRRDHPPLAVGKRPYL
jgi:hypothetical protein